MEGVKFTFKKKHQTRELQTDVHVLERKVSNVNKNLNTGPRNKKGTGKTKKKK